MTKLLVTGRTSFIGSHFVDHVLANTDWKVYSIERLPVRLATSRVQQLFHDLRAEVPQQILDRVYDTDYIVHFAADVSGVKSLADPRLSVETNAIGTFNTLEMARKLHVKKFIQISTGEVVGAMPTGAAAEDAPLRPSNPYAASKAAAEALVNAYHRSFGVPTVVVRSMNVFGPGQKINRFVPMVVKNILEDKTVVVHVDQTQRYGSRNWLHVDHFTKALLKGVKFAKVGEVYHLIGPERNNFEVISILARVLDKHITIATVVPGQSHDFRYSLSNNKVGAGLSNIDLDEDLKVTAQWYNEHREALA